MLALLRSMKTWMLRWHVWLARRRFVRKGFLERRVVLHGEEFCYQVYVPPAWRPGVSMPIVLFLHGSGERGGDGLLQIRIGLPQALRDHPERYPFLVVMPQCRAGVWWPDARMKAVAMAALHESIIEFGADRSRIYLTGISMGGYGTFALASDQPEAFAALVPVCGGVIPPPEVSENECPGPRQTTPDPYEHAARAIGPVPVWLFHGELDDVVPVEESRKMRDAMAAVGAEVRYTEYPEIRHDSWTNAYAEPELPEWLLRHRSGGQ